MKTVQLTPTWAVDNVGDALVIRNDIEGQLTISLDVAKLLADQINAWEIPTGLKDEDGNLISDELAMKGMD